MEPSRRASTVGGPVRIAACRPACFFPIAVLLVAHACSAQRAAVSIVDLAVQSGHARLIGPDARRGSLPGSAIKPFVLWTALSRGVVAPADRMFCDGSLHIGGRNLACTHPASVRVLNASQALAYSCNAYFARLGRQLPPAVLDDGLQSFGLRPAREPEPNRRALVALGLAGQAVSPLALARAYARLAIQLHANSAAADAVRTGLADSVRYGMARAANTPGWVVLGKTGTVDDATPPYQHGWFAAIAARPGEPAAKQRVIVVYAPGASGNEAAMAAHAYLAGLQR